jgi:hypothetical protein
MLRWIVKLVVFRTILRRFWWAAILFAVLRRVLPWEQQRTTPQTQQDRRRGNGWLRV